MEDFEGTSYVKVRKIHKLRTFILTPLWASL